MITVWHFFVFMWARHHHLADLIGYLRWYFPGMSTGWYRPFAKYLLHTYGSGNGLLIAIRPW